MATGFCNRWTYGLGYAWVSKGEVQDTRLQETALRAAGGERLRTKHTSGGRWDRPGLHRLLKQLRPGDVVVVWVVLSRWPANQTWSAGGRSITLHADGQWETTHATLTTSPQFPSLLRRPHLLRPSDGPCHHVLGHQGHRRIRQGWAAAAFAAQHGHDLLG